jgi:hypothetical protein
MMIDVPKLDPAGPKTGSIDLVHVPKTVGGSLDGYKSIERPNRETN